MPQFFIILLKINLVLLLFAAAYYLVLRQLTFYAINRAFLVFGILFSTLYPFIDLTDFFYQQNQQIVAFVPKINHQIKSLVKPVLFNQYWQWLTAFFYFGVVLMAIRLIIQFASLYKMHQKSTTDFIANFKVRVLTEKVSPFSFWQTIYVNPSLHNKEELHAILAHEQIHVKEWHSLDIILAQLSVVFYWFNPGIWLIKKAVKENLEFIADEKTLQKGIDKKAYQYGLLNVGILSPAVSIVNNFNLSDLKKRIIMMNVKRSSRLNLGRYLFVFPCVLLVALIFTISKKEIDKHFEPIKKVLLTANILNDLKQDITPQQKQKTKVNTKPDTFLGAKNKEIDKLLKINDTLDLSITPQSNPASSFKQSESNLKGVINLSAKAIHLSIDTTISKQSVNKYDGVKMFVAKGEFLENAHPDTKNKTVEVRGYRLGTKEADSIRKTSPVVYYNGERLTKDQLDKIGSNDIKTVNVISENGIKAIHVVGYGKKITP